MFSSMKYLTLLIIVSLTAGCGGLDLRKGTVAAGKAGYQLYYPKILVTVSAERTCVEPAENDKCPGQVWEHKCTISEPWILPDFKNGYVATFKRGLGSQSASITIVDGWMLGEASSETDVSALTTKLFEVTTKVADDSCDAGVYEWIDNKFVPVDLPKNTKK